MGIPSYFSYILKHHKHILKRHFIICDNLYLDANSIIYDQIQNENEHYEHIYQAIMSIINKFQPKKTMICFDGVAPLAKMVQQKQRRYKSHLTKKILNQSSSFNTNCITPGTLFMNGLNVYLKQKIDNDTTIVLSGSDESGEGEYKIFEHIRKCNNSKENHIIYGLDADLIMLSLLQLPKQIYLYRETKYFKYLNYIQENQDYLLDVSLLGKQISQSMSIENYCFLCFFCGNDFLPHFPSINIRNHGIDHLLEHASSLNLIQNHKIVWSELYILFERLSKQEHERIVQQIQWKTTRKVHNITHEDRLNYLPLYDRDEEDYLKAYPDKYNMILFRQQNDNSICKQYLEMLEWTWDYYIGNPIDLYKYYPMSYAPLFKSLLNEIPIDDDERLLSPNKNTTFVNPITQLLYVLPYENYDLIPISKESIIKQFPYLKKTEYNIQYAFCHFFWESHVDFGYIPIEELDKYVNN